MTANRYPKSPTAGRITALHMADGGMFEGLKRAVGMGPPETATQKLARQDAARGLKPAAPPAPPVAPAASAISGYAGDAVLDARMKAAGLRDGGDLQTGDGGGVPGVGRGDKVPAKYEPGEFVVSNAMLDAAPELRSQLHTLRDNVLAAQGKTPQQANAQAMRGGVLHKLDGGDEEQKRRALLQQIPTTGNPVAPAPDGSQDSLANTEFGRQATNTISALSGGAGGVAPAVAAGVGRLAAGGGVIARLAANSPTLAAAAPYVPPALGIAALGRAAAAPTPPTGSPSAATVSPAAQTPTAAAMPAAPAAAQPVAASPMSQPSGISGVQKTVDAQGRTLYSDGAAASDASLMVRGPISRQNMAAADALAGTQQSESIGRIQAANFAQQEEGARAFNESVSRRNTPITRGSIAMRGLDLQQQEMGQRGRQFDQKQKLDQARLGLESTTAGLDARGRIQLLAAQDAVTKAKTPEERAAAEDTLRSLQGRYEKAVPNRFTVVPGGKDEMGVTQAAQVLNNQTGEFVTPGGAAKLPAGMKRQIGTANGVPVYEDANGNRVTLKAK